MQYMLDTDTACHVIKGRSPGIEASLHSISINLSYRITMEFLIQNQEIIPFDVGDHDAVY